VRLIGGGEGPGSSGRNLRVSDTGRRSGQEKNGPGDKRAVGDSAGSVRCSGHDLISFWFSFERLSAALSVSFGKRPGSG
jgi:hypothetical protein